MTRLTLVAIAIVVAVTGCAHPRPSRGAPRPDRSRITRSDIDRVLAQSAEDVVRQYRADLLFTRPPSSGIADPRERPAVFLNEIYYGPISQLRNVPIDAIGEIRIFGQLEAGSRFGWAYNGGVIQIILRR